MKKPGNPSGSRCRKFRRYLPARFLVCSLLLAAGLLHCLLLLSALSRAELKNQSPTPLFEDKTGRYLSDMVNPDSSYGFWDIDGGIPRRIRQAVLVIEDKRFDRHPGVDLRSLARTVLHNLAGNPVQGASTIAMQVARLQDPCSRTFPNKLREMYTALLLTARYGREQILRQYLKIVPQGSRMHGVAYAARRYFRKPLADLNWAEAAILAAVMKSPGRMNLFTYQGFELASRRAALVLQLLYREQDLDQAGWQISLRQLAAMGFLIRENRPEHSYHYVLRLIKQYRQTAGSSFTRPLRTPLDPELQDYLQRIADYALDTYRPRGASNIAIIVAEKATGMILGYIGSQAYFDQAGSGSINFAATPRSAGSTLKPFLYALGLQEQCFSPASIIADLPLSILSPGGEYTAGNFDDQYLGPMLYRRALANSRNLPAIRVLEAVGLERTYDFFTTLKLADTGNLPDYYGYGLVLGGLYVTLEQLVTAYGSLANDGREFRLHWLADEEPGSRQQLFSPAAARQITLFLSDTQARMPSFPRLSTLDFPFPVAVKTGTSQGFRDAWTVAYSSRYLVGLWLGHHANDPMNRISGSVTAGLVQRIFTYLQPEAGRGLNEEPFDLPENTIPLKVCVLSGKLATLDCTQVSLEYFTENNRPRTLCQLHQHFVIDKTTGAPATALTPAEQTAVKTYTVFPPEYAAWAAGRGYTLPQQLPRLLPETTLRITSPANGSRLVIDPATPRQFQSIPLQAEVSPAVREIIWYVDGSQYAVCPYPYTTRWHLEEGTHTIQARFARANVYSGQIRVEINPF